MSKVIKSSSVEASNIRAATLGGFAGSGQDQLDSPAMAPADEIRQKTRKVVQDAERRAAQIEREAYERGFEQGEKAGQALGEKKMEPGMRQFQQLVEELANLRSQLVEQNERFILQMGLLAAAEIVHDEISHKPEVVLNNARAALQKVVRGSKLRLRVSPHDYTLVQAHLTELLSRLMNREDFRLEADAEIARGGCILSMDEGDIDAQIDNQLAVLRERLLSHD